MPEYLLLGFNPDEPSAPPEPYVFVFLQEDGNLVYKRSDGSVVAVQEATDIAAAIQAAAAKTTPVDADTVGLVDSADSNLLKQLSWANIKATLKDFFDTIYSAVGHNHDGVYSLTSHNHDGVYSLIGHNHDGVYSLVSHNHDSSYVALSGNQTITGFKTFDGGAGPGAVIISSPNGQIALLNLMRNGVSRWHYRMSSTAEGGGNTGSDFQLSSRTDAGSSLNDSVIFAQRATSNVGFGTDAPQGRIHAYDGTMGHLVVSKTNITTTAQTLIPDGVGDVTVAAAVRYVMSDGTVGSQGVTVGGTITHGSMQVSCSAGGALTVVSTGATITKIAFEIIWL